MPRPTSKTDLLAAIEKERETLETYLEEKGITILYAYEELVYEKAAE